MASELEFLEETTKLFKACPLCESTEGFQVKGRFLKSIECKHCKAEWSSVTMVSECKYLHGFKDKGEHYLKLMKKPSGTDVGEYLIDNPFSVKFWTNPNNSAKKYEEYIEAVLKAVERLRKVPREVGRVEIKNKVNVLLFGPSGNIVAGITPSAKDDEVRIEVIDFTPMFYGNAEAVEKNDFFCFLTSKLIDELSHELSLRAQKRNEQFSLTTYVYEEKSAKEVEENAFYPFNPRSTSISEDILRHLIRCGILKETRPGIFCYSFWDKDKQTVCAQSIVST
jgi:hypothetical protein